MPQPPFNNTIANREVGNSSVISMVVSDVGAAGGKERDKDKEEIKRLRSTNPVYDTYKPLWDFYLAAYEGGGSFANEQNLFKHPREHPDDFRERAKRIYYHNFCFPIVDFFTTFIFSETIQRDGGGDNAWYTDFLNDVNRKGDDITSFMMDVCDDMQIFGMSYVLVDAPPLPDKQVVTVADEKESGIRPYWVSVRPDEVLDWITDKFDRFMYLKRVQTTTAVNPQTMQHSVEEVYTEWTPTTVKVSTIDVTDPGKPKLSGSTTVSNQVGVVPFEVIRFKRSKVEKYIGESFLRDMAFIAREVMNLTSLLQEFLYRQCFNILAIEDDDTVEEQEQMQGDVGTANVMKYPKGAKAPTYITPPVQPADFLQKERENNITAMYRIAAQDTVNELFNGGKSSGFSKSQSFHRTVPKIATRADSLEDLEMKLMRLTAKFAGKSGWNGSVKYKDHYEVTNLADSLSQMGTLFKDLQIQSKTFAKTQLKRMVAEFDGKLSPEDLQKVNDEIDGINYDEWFDLQKLAFIGRAASSPAGDATFGLPVTADPNGAEKVPVKGKDTPTAPSTPQRPTASSSTVQAASTKTPKK